MKRLEALKEKIVTGNKKEGFLVLNNSNLLYLIGFPGSSALLLSKNNDCVVYSYDVNYAYLKKKAKDFTVVTDEDGRQHSFDSIATDRFGCSDSRADIVH